MSITLLTKEEIPFEPDVLLFSNIHPNFLIVGTYHLGEDGSRIGSLLLYDVNPFLLSW